jgi:hypothetical protein
MNLLHDLIGIGLSKNAAALRDGARKLCEKQKRDSDTTLDGIEKRAAVFEVFAQTTSELEKSKIRTAEQEKFIRLKCLPAGREEFLNEAAGCLSWGHNDLAEAEVLKFIAWT